MTFDESSLHSTVEKKLSKNVRVMLISNSHSQQVTKIDDLRNLQSNKNESTQIFMSKQLFNPVRNIKDIQC